ncbi:MAG: hypothetical protein FWF73_01480, partial [Spirochaetes bacterium]|nr:hypothetical protein [Spirochaetota bacterium]
MGKLKKIKENIVSITIIFVLSGNVHVIYAKDKHDRSSGNSYTGESLFRNASFIMDFSYIYRNAADGEISSYEIPTFAAPGVIEYPQSGL